MSSIKLLGETSGEVILKAPATAGSSEATLPTGNHTLVGAAQITGMATADSTTAFTNKSGNISQWTNDSNFITSTVTGDLTVDTDTLKVDSTNNRVGIGTASPLRPLHIVSAAPNIRLQDTDGTGYSEISVGPAHEMYYLADHNNSDSNTSHRWYIDGSEEMRLNYDGDLHVDGDVVAFSTTVSDVALKTDIEMIPNALDKIDEVRGVTFTRHNGQKSAGIIAQELEKVLPEAVREKELKLVDGKKYKTVEYDAIHGLLINCIKELKEEIKELKNGFTK